MRRYGQYAWVIGGMLAGLGASFVLPGLDSAVGMGTGVGVGVALSVASRHQDSEDR